MTSDVARRLLDLHEQVPGYSLANVVETLALLERAKPALRLLVDQSEADEVIPVLTACGLACAVGATRLRVYARTSLGDGYLEQAPADDQSGQIELMFAWEPSVAARCAAAQKPEGADDLGVLLGYPLCCVAAQQVGDFVPDWVGTLLAASPLAPEYPFGTNRFAYLFSDCTLGYELYPCSLGCPGVARIALATRDALLRHGLAELAARAEAEMRRPILVRRGVLVRPLRWHHDGDVVVCELLGAQLRGWQVRPGAETDPAWDCDRVERRAGSLRFFQGDALRFEVAEGHLDDRLLVFT